ncbi:MULTISPECIES: PRD domain-containing protein [Cetobacterium]|uniref:PRD domain-containing protein n=1 Tax=Cetobacterium TaxID=180162 RepID=UPI001F0615E6|nr:PRD domain-containing protein [Cetobacterium somerae]MCX3066843.1 PRD domain-containing protein [Cetobacterium somerae]UPO98558.1 PRD domain-containing protein [Cetobacterium somerae]
MDLQTRLEILNVSGAITDCTKDVMLNVINMFNEKHNIELTEDNGAMMVTHLSMAITRVKNGEPVKTIDEEVFKETLESEHIERANLIYDDLSEVLDVTLPDDEKKYMLVNICVILEK